MTDLAADNARLRAQMRRVIAEREIASKALREISAGVDDPQGRADDALAKMLDLPFPDASRSPAEAAG